MGQSVDLYRTGDLDIDFFISYSRTDEAWAVWIAWELEDLGYRVMLQAWDFVAGSNFIEFMDRGVSESRAVIAVLTDNYLRSRYARMEWQAVLRAAPGTPESRLITIRVEDCDPVGLLSTITYVDMTSVTDRQEARRLLHRRIQDALEGRAKPRVPPQFPPHRPAVAADTMTVEYQTAHVRPQARRPAQVRARAINPAPFPPSDLEKRQCTILHVAGPRYDKTRDIAGKGRHDARELARALRRGPDFRTPDAVVVSGNLTQSGGIREFHEARDFVVGLRGALRLPDHRLAVVPGSHDVTRAASAAYFANCDAEDVEAEPPYWPKWRHYTRFFEEVFSAVETAFVEGQPWSLFPIPDLRIVVAGLNSTVADSHRASDHYGWLGIWQTRWFAEELSEFAGDHWLRLGLVGHPPDQIRDHHRVDRTLRDALSLVVHAPTDHPPITQSGSSGSPPWTSGSTTGPGGSSLLTISVGINGAGISVESAIDIPYSARSKPR